MTDLEQNYSESTRLLNPFDGATYEDIRSAYYFYVYLVSKPPYVPISKGALGSDLIESIYSLFIVMRNTCSMSVKSFHLFILINRTLNEHARPFLSKWRYLESEKGIDILLRDCNDKERIEFEKGVKTLSVQLHKLEDSLMKIIHPLPLTI